MRDLQETKIQGSSLHPLKIYRMQEENGKIDVLYHWQESVEILRIYQGTLDLHICDTDYSGHEGDVFYINPQELHSMQSHGSGCRYLAFVFPISWLQFAQNDEANTRYINPLADQMACICNCFPAQVQARVCELLDEISSWYFQEGDGAWLGIKANFLQLYLCLYQSSMVFYRPKPELGQQLLLQIPQFIQEHCAEKLTLARMGEEFHISPKYFSMFFQKHFGRGFADYLTAVRIEQSKILLLETQNNLEMIAQQTGFSQSAYFIRVFRAFQGMTPAQYRRNCWEQNRHEPHP